MNWNFFLVLSGMSAAGKWLQDRRTERELRRSEARAWVQARLDKGRVGMTRARLVAKQRQNPFSVPEDLQNADADEIVACGAFYLDADENPCDSLEAME